MDDQTLAMVYVKPRRALPFYGRHPWVFSGAIQRIEGQPSPGDVVTLCSNKGEFIARGLFNPDSNIRVRLYSWNESESLDEEFWRSRLKQAIGLRRRLTPEFDSQTATRVVFSEADGLSGLTVDRYGDYLLVQLTSRALADRWPTLQRLLIEQLQPRGVWLRTEKGIGDSESLEIQDGLAWGAEPPRPLFIAEHGIRFGVDVVQGQKTGHFLDQRENRRVVAGYVNGHRVLDLFCYTGGFAIHAARLGAARHVLAIDTSAAALETARANAELNDCGSAIEFRQADAYKALEELAAGDELFDTIILDPPKMARSRSGIERAIRGYFSLNRLAVERLRSDGLLVTCSCSGLIDAAAFESMLSSVATQTGRSIQILEQRGAAADHPVSVNCLETRYLKCYICRVS